MSTSTTENVRSIEETIRQALTERGNGSYMTYAQPAIQALTAREQEISEQLLAFAESMDAPEDEVREALKNAGLTVKDPEPDVEPEDDDDDADENTSRIASALERIEQRIESLTAFARRNGYTG